MAQSTLEALTKIRNARRSFTPVVSQPQPQPAPQPEPEPEPEPQPEQSMLGAATDAALEFGQTQLGRAVTGLEYVGNLFDLPASSVRDTLAGRNPVDQYLDPVSHSQTGASTEGRDLLHTRMPWLFSKNKETGFTPLSDPGEFAQDVAGFATELALDPVSWALASTGAAGGAAIGSPTVVGAPVGAAIGGTAGFGLGVAKNLLGRLPRFVGLRSAIAAPRSPGVLGAVGKGLNVLNELDPGEHLGRVIKRNIPDSVKAATSARVAAAARGVGDLANQAYNTINRVAGERLPTDPPIAPAQVRNPPPPPSSPPQTPPPSGPSTPPPSPGTGPAPGSPYDSSGAIQLPGQTQQISKWDPDIASGDIILTEEDTGEALGSNMWLNAERKARAAMVDAVWSNRDTDIPVKAYNVPPELSPGGIPFSKVRGIGAAEDTYVPTSELKGFTPPTAPAPAPIKPPTSTPQAPAIAEASGAAPPSVAGTIQKDLFPTMKYPDNWVTEEGAHLHLINEIRKMGGVRSFDAGNNPVSVDALRERMKDILPGDAFDKGMEKLTTEYKVKDLKGNEKTYDPALTITDGQIVPNRGDQVIGDQALEGWYAGYRVVADEAAYFGIRGRGKKSKDDYFAPMTKNESGRIYGKKAAIKEAKKAQDLKAAEIKQADDASKGIVSEPVVADDLATVVDNPEFGPKLAEELAKAPVVEVPPATARAASSLTDPQADALIDFALGKPKAKTKAKTAATVAPAQVATPKHRDRVYKATMAAFRSFNPKLSAKATKQIDQIFAVFDSMAEFYSKNSDGKSADDFYASLTDVESMSARSQFMEPKAVGLFTAMKDGQMVIEIAKTADATTFAHEMLHYFRRMADSVPVMKTHLDTAMQEAGYVRNGKWTEQDEEFLAESFTDVLRTGEISEGVTASSGLRKILEDIKGWISSLFEKLGLTREDVHPSISKYFGDVFSKKDLIPKAGEIVTSRRPVAKAKAGKATQLTPEPAPIVPSPLQSPPIQQSASSQPAATSVREPLIMNSIPKDGSSVSLNELRKLWDDPVIRDAMNAGLIKPDNAGGVRRPPVAAAEKPKPFAPSAKKTPAQTKFESLLKYLKPEERERALGVHSRRVEEALAAASGDVTNEDYLKAVDDFEIFKQEVSIFDGATRLQSTGSPSPVLAIRAARVARSAMQAAAITKDVMTRYTKGLMNYALKNTSTALGQQSALTGSQTAQRLKQTFSEWTNGLASSIEQFGPEGWSEFRVPTTYGSSHEFIDNMSRAIVDYIEHDKTKVFDEMPGLSAEAKASFNAAAKESKEWVDEVRLRMVESGVNVEEFRDLLDLDYMPREMSARLGAFYKERFPEKEFKYSRDVLFKAFYGGTYGIKEGKVFTAGVNDLFGDLDFSTSLEALTHAPNLNANPNGNELLRDMLGTKTREFIVDSGNNPGVTKDKLNFLADIDPRMPRLTEDQSHYQIQRMTAAGTYTPELLPYRELGRYTRVPEQASRDYTKAADGFDRLQGEAFNPKNPLERAAIHRAYDPNIADASKQEYPLRFQTKLDDGTVSEILLEMDDRYQSLGKYVSTHATAQTPEFARQHLAELQARQGIYGQDPVASLSRYTDRAADHIGTADFLTRAIADGVHAGDMFHDAARPDTAGARLTELFDLIPHFNRSKIYERVVDDYTSRGIPLRHSLVTDHPDDIVKDAGWLHVNQKTGAIEFKSKEARDSYFNNNRVPKSVAVDMQKVAQDESRVIPGESPEGMFFSIIKNASNVMKAGLLSVGARHARDHMSAITQAILTRTYNPADHAAAIDVWFGRGGENLAKEYPQIADFMVKHDIPNTPEGAIAAARRMYQSERRHSVTVMNDFAGSPVNDKADDFGQLAEQFPGVRGVKTHGEFIKKIARTAVGLDRDPGVSMLQAWLPWNIAGNKRILTTDPQLKNTVRSKSDARMVKASGLLGKYTSETINMGSWLHVMRSRNLNSTDAMKEVLRVQLDYNPDTFSSFEKKLKVLYPFYSFRSREIAFVVNEMLTNPTGGLAKMIRLQNEALPREDYVPEHVKDKGLIPLGQAKPDGTKNYITSLGLMHEDVLSDFGPLLDADAARFARGEISNLHPMIKGVGELAFNQSSFQNGAMGGRSLYEMDPTLGRIFTQLGLQKPMPNEQAAPAFGSRGLEFALANSPFSRRLSQIKGMLDSPERKSLTQKIIGQLTGVKITSVSPEARRQGLRDITNSIAREAGARAFTTYHVSEDLKAVVQDNPRLAEKLGYVDKIRKQLNKEQRDKKKAAATSE